MAFFTHFLYPSLRGILLADIFLIMSVLMCYGIKAGNSFKSVPSDWSIIGQSKAINADNKKITSNSRTSVYFFFAGFSFVILSMRRIVPMPESDSSKSSFSKKKPSHSHQASLFLLDEPVSTKRHLDFSIDMEIEMSTIIEWKRNCLLVKYFLSLTYFIIKFQLLTVPFYKHQFILFNALLNIIETLTDEIYLKYVFNEALHAAPILCVSKISRFVMFLGSPSLGKTVFAYIVNVFEDSLLRLFAMPFFGRIEYLISRKIEVMATKRRRKYKGVWWYIYSKWFMPSNVDKKEQIDYDLIYFYEKPKQLQYLIEPILRCLFIYSTDVTSSVMKIHLMLLFYVFREEALTQEVFNMKTISIIKQYIIVSIAITVIEVPLAYGIVNVIETMYKLNIMEYVKYCNYRYSIRNTSWLNPMNIMDVSVHSFWRSLDSLLFSEQYYYSLYNAASGLTLIMFSFTVALNNNYNPFNDPFLVLFLFIYVGILIASVIFGKLFDYFGGIFSFKPFNLNNKDSKMPELLKLDSSNKDLANFMTNSLFRRKFIKTNKKWIIDNLDFILGFDKLGKELAEGLSENANEKLKQIYNEALNYEEIDNEIKEKKDDIKHNLKFMPYNRKDDCDGEFNAEYGMRLDISKDSIIDEPPCHCEGKVNKEIVSKPYMRMLCRIWKNKAQERIKYKVWSVNIINKCKMSVCQLCNADFNLHVRQEVGIDVLIKEYKDIVKERGMEENMKTWEEFYKKRQCLMTLCMECAYLKDLEVDRKKREVSEEVNEEKEEEEKRKGGIGRALKKGRNRRILYAWLIEARSRILVRRMKRREEQGKKEGQGEEGKESDGEEKEDDNEKSAESYSEESGES